VTDWELWACAQQVMADMATAVGLWEGSAEVAALRAGVARDASRREHFPAVPADLVID